MPPCGRHLPRSRYFFRRTCRRKKCDLIFCSAPKGLLSSSEGLFDKLNRPVRQRIRAGRFFTENKGLFGEGVAAGADGPGLSGGEDHFRLTVKGDGEGVGV